MPWYQHKDWITWSKEDVEEYASELTTHFRLSDSDAESLRWRMCMRRTKAREERARWQGPRKMSDETALMCLQIAASKEEETKPANPEPCDAVWLENKRLNEPYEKPKLEVLPCDLKTTTLGGGLTRRQFFDRSSPFWKREAIRQKYKTSYKDMPRKAFSFQRRDVEHCMRELLWQNDYLTPNDNDWLCPEGGSEPYDGLFWYYNEVLEHLQKADRKRKQCMHEEALCLAMDAGSLFQEMQIRAAHGDFYLKSEITRERQTAAGKSNKIRDDGLAQERWRFYFQQGLTKTEAGWQAAEELKCSEPTIRRAFGGSYPSS